MGTTPQVQIQLHIFSLFEEAEASSVQTEYKVNREKVYIGSFNIPPRLNLVI